MGVITIPTIILHTNSLNYEHLYISIARAERGTWKWNDGENNWIGLKRCCSSGIGIIQIFRE